MYVARSIFTLGGQIQLFWTAFDMPVTGVPLEVALGWQKFYFCKCVSSEFFYYFLMPINLCFLIIIQLLMVTLSWAYQKLSKTIESPNLK